jgi:hypothetical protein
VDNVAIGSGRSAGLRFPKSVACSRHSEPLSSTDALPVAKRAAVEAVLCQEGCSGLGAWG